MIPRNPTRTAQIPQVVRGYLPPTSTQTRRRVYRRRLAGFQPVPPGTAGVAAPRDREALA